MFDEVEIISERTWKSRQTRSHEVVARMPVGEEDMEVVRLRVRVDSYAFQSRATAEVWSRSKGEWSEVHAIPGEELDSQELANPHKRAIASYAFDEDLMELWSVLDGVLYAP